MTQLPPDPWGERPKEEPPRQKWRPNGGDKAVEEWEEEQEEKAHQAIEKRRAGIEKHSQGYWLSWGCVNAGAAALLLWRGISDISDGGWLPVFNLVLGGWATLAVFVMLSAWWQRWQLDKGNR